MVTCGLRNDCLPCIDGQPRRLPVAFSAASEQVGLPYEEFQLGVADSQFVDSSDTHQSVAVLHYTKFEISTYQKQGCKEVLQSYQEC